MFNNPFFKAEASQQRSSQAHRPSVEDVMLKYSARPQHRQSQEQRSDTKQPVSIHSSPSNNQFLTESSLMSEQNGSVPAYTQVREFPAMKFQNPLSFPGSLVLDNRPTNNERVTFGQNSGHLEKREFSPIPQLPSPINTKKDLVFVEPQADDELYDEMQGLKEKVLGMLQRYTTNLQDSNGRKEVKHRLKQDAKAVQKEYSQIIEKFNQSDISGLTDLSCISSNPKKEQELQMMFNLVDEFLTKFQPELQKTAPNSYQGLLQVKMQKSGQFSQAPAQSLTPRNNFPIRTSPIKSSPPIVPQRTLTHTSSIKERIIKPLRSSSSSMNRLSMDPVDSNPTPQFSKQFNSPKKLSPTRSNPTLDMTVLPQFPSMMEDSFYSGKKISPDHLSRKLRSLQQKLAQELEKENLPYTKIILGEMVENLNTLVAIEDEQLAKTIAYKIEQGIREVRDSKEGSLKLYHYLNKAIKHSRMKMEQVKQVRYSEPLPQSKTEHLNIVRFTEQSNPLSVKRQFFDVALSKKHALPIYHAGHGIMVSELYDRFLERKVPLQQMEKFISDELEKITK